MRSLTVEELKNEMQKFLKKKDNEDINEIDGTERELFAYGILPFFNSLLKNDDIKFTVNEHCWSSDIVHNKEK